MEMLLFSLVGQARRLAQRTWPIVFFGRRVCDWACDRSAGMSCVTTHATWLSESGATIRAAQDLLGQSDMETTLRVYTHSVPDSKRRAKATVAALLFPSVPPQGRPLRGSRSYVVEKKEETGNFGEPGRTRTCNPLIKSQLLYH